MSLNYFRNNYYKKSKLVDVKYSMGRESSKRLKLKIIGLDEPNALCKKSYAKTKSLIMPEKRLIENIKGF